MKSYCAYLYDGPGDGCVKEVGFGNLSTVQHRTWWDWDTQTSYFYDKESEIVYCHKCKGCVGGCRNNAKPICPAIRFIDMRRRCFIDMETGNRVRTITCAGCKEEGCKECMEKLPNSQRSWICKQEWGWKSCKSWYERNTK